MVVLTTQCLEEGVEYGIYEVGSQLQDKIIIAGDFNIETWWQNHDRHGKLQDH